MHWIKVTDSMLETDDKVFQISRAPSLAGRVAYRAWRRENNDILLTVSADDTPELRKAAVASCMRACEEASRE